MTQSTLQTRQSESGFTLVELAIVMIIIGLLIGGILKGQELINNARVSSTAAQAKAIEAGISTFRDKFAGMPGDLTNPAARIANCTGMCTYAAGFADGDGHVQPATANDPGAVSADSEAARAFVQLGAAGMLGGVQGTAAGINAVNSSNPSTSIGGAWQFGYSEGTLGTGRIGAINMDSGHYIVSVTTLGTVAGAGGNNPFTPSQAANLDRKLDDGSPNAGTIRATGSAGAGNCTDLATAAGIYQEAVGTSNCGLFIKVQ